MNESGAALGALIEGMIAPESTMALRWDPTHQQWQLTQGLPTGEMRSRSVRVGSEVFSAEVAVLSPVVVESGESLEALARGRGVLVAAEAEESPWERECRTSGAVAAELDKPLSAGVAGWRAALIERARARAAAGEELGLVACSNCSGAGSFELECGCARGSAIWDLGRVIPGAESASAAAPVEIRLTPEAEELTEHGGVAGCARCDGAGMRTSTCPCCRGRALMRTDSRWELRASERSQVLELEMLRVIAHHPETLSVISASMSGWGSVRVSVELGELVEDALGKLGHTRARSRASRTGRLRAWEELTRVEGPSLRWVRESPAGGQWRWQERDMDWADAATMWEQVSDTSALDGVLNDLVVSWARAQAWSGERAEEADEHGAILDSGLRSRGWRYEVTVRPGPTEDLECLKEWARRESARLVVRSCFIATGEWGYEVLVERDEAGAVCLGRHWSSENALGEAAHVVRNGWGWPSVPPDSPC